MKNLFYTDFDFERLTPSDRKDDYRSPFQIDRDRIIYSSEFRRLQAKTQVFLPGEYDFYRTRLTHSIEVAQIGRSICNFLKITSDKLYEDFFIDSDLVESICLAHDLGHPPFGHAGERTLNNLMKKFGGGFEGNAQTLRLLTEIFYRTNNGRRGMNPTRALLDGVLKYKTLYSQLDDPENHFIYDEQKSYLYFAFDNNKFPDELTAGTKLNSFRSVECQIMDWADDTAYAVNDLVDSISGGFITIIKLERWMSQQTNLDQPSVELIEQIIKWIKKSNYKQKFGSLIGEAISALSLEEANRFMSDKTNRYFYDLRIEKEVVNKINLYKRISNDLVFQSPELHQMEFKGNHLISSVFNALYKNYINDLKEDKLLHEFTDSLIRQEPDKEKRTRLVCDYISGMTDNYAVRNYKRLFDPDYSLFIELA